MTPSCPNRRSPYLSFFEHNNHHHRHSGIGLHTPADVHYGRADQIRAARQVVLDAAYTARPERFRRPPSAPQIPEPTWINPPEETPLATQAVCRGVSPPLTRSAPLCVRE